jgi:hypothetical protein
MDFKDFTAMDFPPKSGPGFVYILFWVDGDKEVPFYVGQTQSVFGRLNDYYWADFYASTDFNVGEAVKRFSEKGYRVVTKYKPSANQRQDEATLIDTLKAEGYKLLNRQLGYNYEKTTDGEQKPKVQQFVDDLLAARTAAR